MLFNWNKSKKEEKQEDTNSEKKEIVQPIEETKSKKPEFIRYKHKDLKVYAIREWMADSTFRYRKVFDRMEVSYMYFEFSFYNKLFDEEAWEANIIFKCSKMEAGKATEWANLTDKVTVKVEDNIAYVRNSWGKEAKGSYWVRGDYLVEAFIDNVKVGDTKFYVEDCGIVTPGSNPYFDVESIKFYLEDANKVRRYITKVGRKDTDYLMLEFTFKNKMAKDYFAELFFNFKDDAGQVKGKATTFQYIKANTENTLYNSNTGWGSSVPGTWIDDAYVLDIVFMDNLVASVYFKTEDTCAFGELNVFTKSFSPASPLTAAGTTGAEITAPEKSLTELLADLDKLTGMDSVKKSIREQISFIEFQKLRKEKGIDENTSVNLHSVFTGNPGTGKTTVVNMLGQIYKTMGLLSKGHVHEVDRADLVAQFIGQTAPKVKEAIKTARGGILFIDEAYALTRSDSSNDFGPEVIEIILKEMSDGDGDLAIICAGYPKEMEDFIASNPGLKSRFGQYFHFEDYLPEDLALIGESGSKRFNVMFSPEAKTFLEEKLVDAYRTRDRSFGNARYVLALVREAKENLAMRLMKLPNVKELTKEQMSLIELQDVQEIFDQQVGKKLKLKTDDKALREVMLELNSLVGMNNLKTEINELMKLVRFYQEVGKDALNKFSLHTVFLGNPGTGKTTVARLIGKIYKSLGLLERGHLVEVDREALVAGYVGQTAIKTGDKITEAMGGILFIDEAYSLTSQGSSNDFGAEAIQIILKRMEDFRGKFAVIVAGYPGNMHEFMESNPGLKSRFDKSFMFYDYSPEEMNQIALSILAKEKLMPDVEAADHLKKYFQVLHDNRDKNFGNARTVRQVIGEAIKNQNLRLAELPAAERTPAHLEIITLDDVIEFELKADLSKRESIGFKFNKI